MMRVQLWQYTGVNPDGTHDGEGSIVPFAQFRTSRENQYDTPSARAAGDWLSVSTGRLPDGSHTGITLYFDSRDEMEAFLQDSNIG